jgi:hypothetical protein
MDRPTRIGLGVKLAGTSVYARNLLALMSNPPAS